MRRNVFSIGRIFGIEIEVDYSWFIIFILVTWSLAVGYFRQGYPGWAPTLYWFIAIITSLLFFASVLAHELAHSLVARSRGTPVHSIRLFIFGGVSEITQEPKSARDEFRFTIVGPLTSFVLGLAFGAGWWATREWNHPVAALAEWLSYINLLLAGFNLIPGFPLDGGRVFRSIIWGLTGDLRKATRLAVIIGQGVAFLFIGGGVIMIFQGFWINGLWFAFIGWFLENAAAQSWRQFTLQELLKGHKVREAMSTDCPRISPSLTLDELVHDHILSGSRRCLPVMDGDRLLGIVTPHNVRGIPREQWAVERVEQVMIPMEQVKQIRPDEELLAALQLMTQENVNQLLVTTDAELAGVIARDNVLTFIRTRAELEL